MKLSSRGLTLLALLAATAEPLDGQAFGLGLHGGRISDENGIVHTGATISPEVNWLRAGWSARAGLSATMLSAGTLIGTAAGEGDALLWRGGPAAVVLGGSGSATATDLGYRAASLAVAPGLRLTLGGVTGELRGVVRMGGEGQTGARSRSGILPFPDGASPDGLLWRRADGVGGAITASPGPLQASLGWTRMRTQAGEAWTDWNATTGVDLRHAAFTAVLGHRVGVAAGSWASVQAILPLSATVAAAVALGSQPADPMTGRARARFATLGLRVSSGRGGSAAAPAHRPQRPIAGGELLVLEADAGAQVELLADWTEWHPQRVTESRPGVFTVPAPRKPGRYRFAFRVDGRWTVPPGYPTEPDEYGGRRAVLRVE